MVIELSGVQIGLKSYVCFQSERVRFEITSMISAQNCSTRRKFSCHFITSILKSHNLICQTMPFLSFIFLQCDWLVWKSLKIWLVVLLSNSHWLRKRCNSERKIVGFVNKLHRLEPITLQGKFNKCQNLLLSFLSFKTDECN